MGTLINLPLRSLAPGMISCTWGLIPPASSATGEIVYVSNIGVNGSYWLSNGSVWRPVNGEVTLAQSGASVSLTGTTTQTVLATYTLPGGLMTTYSQIEITCLWSHTNSANAKTPRINHSAVGGGIVGDVYYSCAVTTTETLHCITCIRSDNSLSAQKGWGIGSAGPGGVGVIASTLRQFNRATTSNSDINITAQLANSGESITLRAYSIVLRG